jgi:fatty acid desaturase
MQVAITYHERYDNAGPSGRAPRTQSVALGVTQSCEDAIMLWTIAVILFILWILGFFVVHVGGGLIHLLLVIAVIVIIYRLITGRPVV